MLILTLRFFSPTGRIATRLSPAPQEFPLSAWKEPAKPVVFESSPLDLVPHDFVRRAGHNRVYRFEHDVLCHARMQWARGVVQFDKRSVGRDTDAIFLAMVGAALFGPLGALLGAAVGLPSTIRRPRGLKPPHADLYVNRAFVEIGRPLAVADPRAFFLSEFELKNRPP